MSLRSFSLGPALAAALGFAAPAAAVVFQVDSTQDDVDATIDGVCATAAGVCTLRAAIQEAGATIDADEIEVPAGKYVLKRVGPFENFAESGDLDISADLVIRGAGAGLTVVQGKKDRVFDIFGETVVEISDLTVTKGAIVTKLDNPPEEPEGGGISVFPGATVALTDVVVSRSKCSDDGGGIANFGNLTLTRVTIERNTAHSDAGGLYNAGGGVATLVDVTLSRNKAKSEGGGIESQSEITLTNVTLSGNKARETGGAIHNDEGTVTLTHATIKGNKSGKAGAGGLAQQAGGGPLTVVNTILDGNKPANCGGAITSGGGNLETGLACGFPPEVSGFKKLGLAGLKDNGGGMRTHALSATSPAIDAAIDLNCPAADQRGQARVDVPGVGTSLCDSGAFEFVPAP